MAAPQHPVGGLKKFGAVREPSASEREFFQTKRGRGTHAYAADDGSVVFNPGSVLSAQQRSSLLLNERARISMRTIGPRPAFAMTPEQTKSWAWYSQDPQDIRETLVSRYLSGDPSAGDITAEQRAFADVLHKQLAEYFQEPLPKGGLAR